MLIKRSYDVREVREVLTDFVANIHKHIHGRILMSVNLYVYGDGLRSSFEKRVKILKIQGKIWKKLKK